MVLACAAIEATVDAITTAIKPVFNTLAARVQPMVDAIALDVQTVLNAIALSVQPLRQLRMAGGGSCFRPSIEAIVNAFAFRIQAIVNAVTAGVKAILNALAFSIEPRIDAVTAIWWCIRKHCRCCEHEAQCEKPYAQFVIRHDRYSVSLV